MDLEDILVLVWPCIQEDILFQWIHVGIFYVTCCWCDKVVDNWGFNQLKFVTIYLVMLLVTKIQVVMFLVTQFYPVTTYPNLVTPIYLPYPVTTYSNLVTTIYPKRFTTSLSYLLYPKRFTTSLPYLLYTERFTTSLSYLTTFLKFLFTYFPW